jgi:hypothetical protein
MLVLSSTIASGDHNCCRDSSTSPGNSVGTLLDCYCCNCLGERRWEVKPESHFCRPISSDCHVTPCCEHAFFLGECFLTSCLILFVMVGKVEHVCNMFCMKLGKFATKILHEAFWEHSLSQTLVFEWHSPLKTVDCQLKMTNVQELQNYRKCWNYSRPHPRRSSSNSPWSHRHCWGQLWSLPGDLNRKFEHGTTLLQRLFPNLKNDQKQHHINMYLEYFEAVSDLQSEL